MVLRLGEDAAQIRLGFAIPLAGELSATHRVEGGASLVSDGAGDLGLAGAWRAEEQDATRGEQMHSPQRLTHLGVELRGHSLLHLGADVIYARQLIPGVLGRLAASASAG